MPGNVERFYDEFATKLLSDYVVGNPRIARQLEFFAEAIPARAAKVLVIGSGNGHSAHVIAKRIARKASVLAVDISDRNINIAKALFPHRRITYRRTEVVEDALEGRFDVIALPDVYEHIPRDQWPALHRRLNAALDEDGRILLTLPSPAHQAMLRAQDHGLQIVDETVTIDDLLRLARDVGGHLGYFALICVFQTNDYIHAVIERGAQTVAPIRAPHRLPIKRQCSVMRDRFRRWFGRTGKFWAPIRRMRVRWRLRTLVL